MSEKVFGQRQQPTFHISASFPIGIQAAAVAPVAAIPRTPTHVVIKAIKISVTRGTGSTAALVPGMQVRVIRFEGERALIARKGTELGFVEATALLKLQW